MNCYELQRTDDPDTAECYWLAANSEVEARRVVAATVPSARGATDPAQFRCAVSSRERPPWQSIYRRRGEPLTIAWR
jgi:hypothetical protein